MVFQGRIDLVGVVLLPFADELVEAIVVGDGNCDVVWEVGKDAGVCLRESVTVTAKGRLGKGGDCSLTSRRLRKLVRLAWPASTDLRSAAWTTGVKSRVERAASTAGRASTMAKLELKIEAKMIDVAGDGQRMWEETSTF
jgi:hypothetical protein